MRSVVPELFTLPDLSGPFLWFANRGTGIVLLVLYTLVVAMGIIAASGRGPGRHVPRFVSQGLHRNLALLATLLLVAHIATAILDTYVDIRWFDAFLPVGGLYRPAYLGFGAVSVDLLLAVCVTSLVRHRLSDRTWRRLHLLAYPSWAAAVVHTVGIGTDIGTPWARWILVGCLGVVAAAVAGRSLGRLALSRS